MKTKIVEAGNNEQNWGKFLIAQFTEEEWARKSAAPMSDEFQSLNYSVLGMRGWHPSHIIVFDLETCEGAAFSPGGSASADLYKHQIWVCPMFEPFLEWLYDQYRQGEVEDIKGLPDYVNLPDAPFAMAGYRRPGPA